MKAAIYQQFQEPLTVETVPDPKPKPNGVIVKVTATGLCLSDWHGWMGHDPDIKPPHVPGHELVGTIAELGKGVSKFKVGDRVTVPFVCACGSCLQCHSGNQQVCDHQSQPGFTHWGSFAEYVAIDYADLNLIKLPYSLEDVSAATLGCRFITSFRAVVDQGKVKPGQFVVVHGCGGVGLSAIMIANAMGAQVVAVDIDHDSLMLARDLGAKHLVNPVRTPDMLEQIKTLTEGGAHVSLDAVGSQTTCYNSIANLRKRGKHIQVGLMAGKNRDPKVPMHLVIAKELEILGSHGMQAYRYPEMLQMISSGILAPEKLIEGTISLSKAAEELPRMNTTLRRGVLVIDDFR